MLDLEPIPATDWRNILRKDPCAYCGDPGGAVDHIIPRSQGGVRDHTNETGCCQSCNSRKYTTPLMLFMAGVGVRMPRVQQPEPAQVDPFDKFTAGVRRIREEAHRDALAEIGREALRRETLLGLDQLHEWAQQQGLLDLISLAE